jgi:hypothetical protein
MPPREPLPPHLRDRAFVVAEAREIRVGEGRLRGPDLAAPHHGLRVPVHLAATGVVDRARAFAPLMRPAWCFSHLTALALWGLPLPLRARRDEAPLHVASDHGHGPRRPGVVGHRWHGPSWQTRVVTLTGLPVVDPVTAWRQSAAWLTLDETITVADSLAGRWSPYAEAREVPIADLASAVEHSLRSRGAGTLRRALPLVRADVESPKETELRLLLHRAGLPEPEVNVRTYADDDLYLGKPDLRWSLFRVCTEYEGDEHRVDRRRYRNDISRRERFADAGWRMVRVTEDDLHGAASERLLVRFRHLLGA